MGSGCEMGIREMYDREGVRNGHAHYVGWVICLPTTQSEWFAKSK